MKRDATGEIVKEMYVDHYENIEFIVTIGWRASGRYIPATLTQPEEYPEFEWWIKSIHELSGDITDGEIIDAQDDIQEQLEKSDILAEVEQAASDYAEARWQDDVDRRIDEAREARNDAR